MSGYACQIAVITETHLKPAMQLPNMKDYVITRKDRMKKKGGGVAIIVSITLRVEVIDEVSETDFEVLWVRVTSSNKDATSCWIIGGVYYPPNPTYDTHLLIQKIENDVIKLSNEYQQY